MTAARLGRLVLAVLIAHLLLLDALDRALDALDRGSRERPPAMLSVRTIWAPVLPPTRPPVAATAEAAVPTPIAAATPPTPPAVAVATPGAQAARPTTTRLLPSSATPEPTPDPVREPAQPVVATAAMAPNPVAVTPPDAPAVEVPTYRTVVPPPFAFAYDLRRGERTGRAELHWDPQAARYTARLTGSLDGRPWIAWDSEGAFDVDGLAPRRHVDRRHGRSALAANFQREAGKITFSGPTVEHPLARGAQDGLSWLVQLSAIAAADPSLVGPGGRVLLRVVGVRGEADVWTFVHVGEERLSRGDGEVKVVRMLRDPQGLHEVRAEVWLDSADHYLPVRFSIAGTHGAGELLFDLIDKPQRP